MELRKKTNSAHNSNSRWRLRRILKPNARTLRASRVSNHPAENTVLPPDKIQPRYGFESHEP